MFSCVMRCLAVLSRWIGVSSRDTIPARCSRTLDSGETDVTDAPGTPARSQLFEPSSTGPFEVAASVGNDGKLEPHLAMHSRGREYLLKWKCCKAGIAAFAT